MSAVTHIANDAQPFRHAAQFMPTPVWILDGDARIEWANDRFRACIGAASSDDFLACVHADDRERCRRLWESGSASDTPVEIRLAGHDGDWRWHAVQIADAPFAVRGGAAWIGSATDIDAHLRQIDFLKRDNDELEQDIFSQLHELNRSRARLQTIFDACPDYLYVLRLAKGGVVTFEDINPAAAVLFEGERAGLIGRDVAEVAGLESATGLVAHVQAALRGGQIDYQVERGSDGKPVMTVQFVGARLAYSNEEEGLVLFCGRDITDQRTAEEALRQSQKMEAVGQLTGGLAHDFNNLLTGIMGSLDLLQMRVARREFDRVDRYVQAAQEGAARAASLTHRLLAFSRRQTLDPKPVDANRLVVGMEDLLRRTVGPEIAISFSLADALWTVLVDPSQLENALLNLCINARDAMPEGGRIAIETTNTVLGEQGASERDLPPGDYVALSVSDDGTGMPPEVAARIFDPFFTTKPLGSGTGLGLSMIYGFARQSGGNVRVHTRAGMGTTMRILLPRIHEEARDERVNNVLSAAPPARPGETVLLVDDEQAVRSLAAEVLEDLGYAITIAVDGARGVEHLRSAARFDVLVTDVGLPGGLNGRQVAEEARALRPGIKVLFITGYAENAVLNHGHLSTGMQVLTKPFSMETLASRLRALLDTQ